MNQNSTNRVELLAPAGNYESFLGAINAGADAVYLGGNKFGARAYADNFTEEEICKAIRYAHLFGKRVYLTVNTLIKESEFPELVPYIQPFYEAGLDGVIVQDIGAFLTINEAFPRLKLHVSTQMTVTGSYAANMLKDMGAVRIVPARELSLEEIRSMKEETGLELETFIHGAMCYCYSGQCLFSSILGGRSGNRGRCAQPCRLPYRTTGITNEPKNNIPLNNANKSKVTKEQYPLSLKDMCSIAFLPKLIEAGIDSFKIEGRMKKPEYAAGVTAIYRKYIDLYYKSGKKAYKVEPADLEKLSSLYIRSGIQDGYYFKHNGADMITLYSPAYNGSDDALLSSIRKQYIETTLKKEIKMRAVFEIGHASELTISCGDVSVTVNGDVVQEASKQPITDENVKNSLQKLGNTPFSVKDEDIELILSQGAFYSLKALNELRRNGVEKLESKICNAFKDAERKAICDTVPSTYESTVEANGELISQELSVLDGLSQNVSLAPCKAEKKDAALHIAVRTKEQLDALKQSGIKPDILYLDTEIQELSPEFVKKVRLGFSEGAYRNVGADNNNDADGMQDTNCAVYIALPYIIRKKDIPYLEKLLPVIESADGVLVRNMESYSWLVQHGFKGKINTDAGIYTFNKSTLQFWQSKADICCLPYELNKKEMRRLCEGSLDTEQIVYGRIPLMITANCVAKTTHACKKGSEGEREILLLTDRYNKNFPVMTNCTQCYNVIYNAVPLSLHEKVSNKEINGALRLQFTVEKAEETGSILNYWKKILKGEKKQPPYAEYTLGHEKRGVE